MRTSNTSIHTNSTSPNSSNYYYKIVRERNAAKESALDIRIRTKSSGPSLQEFVVQKSAQLHCNGRIRTAETYMAAFSSFARYIAETNPIKSQQIRLSQINGDLIHSYNLYLEGQDVCQNTISFYNRILRAIYNRAVNESLIADNKPFCNVYTGIAPTRKRALSLDAIRHLFSLNISGCAGLEFARDMFMLSFMLRGMSLVDMCSLRKSDLNNGYLIYRRRKTGTILTLKWTSQMQAIVDKYPQHAEGYLLPLLKDNHRDVRRQYLNASYNINRNLKSLGQMIGLEYPLTMYVARHSWATIARLEGIPLSVISEGLGHRSEHITYVYLESINTNTLDQANQKVINSVL